MVLDRRLSTAILVVLILAFADGEINDRGLPNSGDSISRSFAKFSQQPRQDDGNPESNQPDDDDNKEDNNLVVFSLEDLLLEEEPNGHEETLSQDEEERVTESINKHSKENIEHPNKQDHANEALTITAQRNQEQKVQNQTESGEQSSEAIQKYLGLEKHKEKAAEVAHIFADDFLKQILKRTSFSMGHVKPKMREKVTIHPNKTNPNTTALDAKKINTSANETLKKEDVLSPSSTEHSFESTLDIEMHFKTKEISGGNRKSKSLIVEPVTPTVEITPPKSKAPDLKYLPRIRTQQRELPQQCQSDCFMSGQIFLSKNIIWSNDLKDRTSDEYNYLAKVLRGQITQLIIDSYLGKHLDEIIIDTFVPYDDGVLADIFVSFKDLSVGISDHYLISIFNSGLVDSFLGPYHLDTTLTFFKVMTTQQAKAVFQRPFDFQEIIDKEELNETHTKLALIGVGAICFAIPGIALLAFSIRKCRQAKKRDASRKLADLEKAQIRAALDSSSSIPNRRLSSEFGSQVALNSSLTAMYNRPLRHNTLQPQMRRFHPRTSSVSSNSMKRLSLPIDNRRLPYRPASRNGSLSSLSCGNRAWSIQEMDETMDDVNNTTYETISDSHIGGSSELGNMGFRTHSNVEVREYMMRHAHLMESEESLNVDDEEDDAFEKDDVETAAAAAMEEQLIEFSRSSDDESDERQFQENIIIDENEHIYELDDRSEANNEGNVLVNLVEETAERFKANDLNVFEGNVTGLLVNLESSPINQVAVTVDFLE